MCIGIYFKVDRIVLWNEEHARRPMLPLNPLQQLQHDNASACFMCKKPFVVLTLPRVRDHCHLSGRYRGPACQPCNTKARMQRNTVPVLFHNFKGLVLPFVIIIIIDCNSQFTLTCRYDAHHFVKEGVVSRPHCELGIIATYLHYSTPVHMI